MKRLSYYLLLVLTLFFVTNCEYETEVIVDDAERLIAVDAWLNNQDTLQTIKISLSQAYFDSTLVEGIEEAVIRVTSSTGKVFYFEDIGAGNYNYDPNTNGILGAIGDQFELEIQLEEEILTSFATINRVTEVDYVEQLYFEEEADFAGGIYCDFYGRDLEGSGDTYWIKTFKNGIFLNRPNELNLAYDGGQNVGLGFDNIVFVQPIRQNVNELDAFNTEIPWEFGDEIRIEIHSLSAEAFFFLQTMKGQQLNADNGIFAGPIVNTLGNVASNFEDRTMLGIFNVAAVTIHSEKIR